MAAPDTIHTIYIAMRAKLARAVMRIVPPKEVEDIVQETYVRVCQADSVGSIRTPRSFLLKTARNLALDHVKSAQFRLSASADEMADGELPVLDRPGDETFAQVSSNEEFARFCEAVKQLPVQCRRAFVLRKVYGYSQREIAAAMNLSESTVEKHIGMGIRRCAEAMRRVDSPGDESGTASGERKKRGTGAGKGPSA